MLTLNYLEYSVYLGISMIVGITSKSALLIVDVQNDFCAEDGALPVKGCTSIIPKINEYINMFTNKGLTVIASRDWHPPNHISFKDRGGPWPPHCIQGSKGAEFHPDLKLPSNVVIISKAFLPDKEAYSAFDGTELHYILTLRGIRRLFVTGVATDYCVKASVIDALRLGYEVIVLSDAIAGVSKESSDRALEEMVRLGAIIASKDELKL